MADHFGFCVQEAKLVSKIGGEIEMPFTRSENGVDRFRFDRRKICSRALDMSVT